MPLRRPFLSRYSMPFTAMESRPALDVGLFPTKALLLRGPQGLNSLWSAKPPGGITPHLRRGAEAPWRRRDAAGPSPLTFTGVARLLDALSVPSGRGVQGEEPAGIATLSGFLPLTRAPSRLGQINFPAADTANPLLDIHNPLLV